MPSDLSDKAFLKEFGYREEIYERLDDQRPVYSQALQAQVLSGIYSNWFFTQNPRSDLERCIQDVHSSVWHECSESLRYAEENLNSFLAGRPMLFSYNLDHYREEVAASEVEFNIVNNLPRWYDRIGSTQTGLFTEETENTEYFVLRVAVADLKALYLHSGRYKPKSKVRDAKTFYRSFIRTLLESITDDMEYVVNITVPTVADMLTKKGELEELFAKYRAAPVGSLIKMELPNIKHIFTRKFDEGLSPGDGRFTQMNPLLYTASQPAVLIGSHTKVEDSSVIQLEIGYDCPIHQSMQVISANDEDKVIRDALDSAKSCHVTRDKIVTRSGWARLETIQGRIRKALEIPKPAQNKIDEDSDFFI